MNKYELALVVNAKIEDEERNAVVDSIKDIVANASGQNIEVVDGGRRDLAYPIQKMSQGNYYFIKFEAEPTAPADIEQRVRIKDNVLRFLCVRQDEE
jgi:small subunit ribosomal protein S6